MRLICPNCDAQYEVPDEVIPTEGRDVQCSNCGKTWFQPHPSQAREAPPPAQDDSPVVEAESAPTPPPPPPSPVEDDTPDTVFDEVSAPSRRSVAPDVADILREEAEQEARARAEEREALESQPDLGLQDPSEEEADRRARQARERMARMRGEPTDGVEESVAAAAAASRRDLLPDIDEINSTLRSGNERPASTENRTADELPPKPPKGRSFRLGFIFAVLVAIGALYVYTNAPTVSTTIPQADPWVNAFVARADNARAWLDGQTRGVIEQINALTGG